MAGSNSSTNNLHCSFCGKHQDLVRKLIGGHVANICDECVEVCNNVLNEAEAEETEETTGVATSGLPSPREIKAFLDDFVVGQDDAKKTVAVAVYDHYKRLLKADTEGVEIDKSNVLLVGPTGCGKTLIAQSVARFLDVPFAMTDATSLTEAGYVGEDVETLVGRLLAACGHDVAKAERGIIFIDEIDKKRTKEGPQTSKDVSGEGVQQALLKMLEGSDVLVPPAGGKKTMGAEMIKVNTKNILFIVSGAFVGLDKIVEREEGGKGSIGFAAAKVGETKVTATEAFKKLKPKHLVKYGLIPELVGRLPVIAALEELTEDQLVHVLTEPKNAITKQMQVMFKLDGVELDFDAAALHEIAKLAIAEKTGARGLRGVIEKRLMPLKFDLPDLFKQGAEKVVIGEGMFAGAAEPTVLYKAVEESASA